jgi:photosystem II stability/assembly factor-like uncharacterized protein
MLALLCVPALLLVKDRLAAGAQDGALAEYRKVQFALAHRDDGEWRHYDERPSAALLERAWESARDALAADVRTRPGLDAAGVAQAVEALNPPDVPQDPDDPETGWEERERFRVHAHALTVRDGGARVHVVALTFGLNAEDSRWLVMRQREDGVDVLFFGGRAPAGDLIPLAPTRAGRPRFFAHHVYVKMAGCCSAADVGIWEWDGKQIVARFEDSLPVHCGVEGVELQGELLRFDVEPALQTLNECCGCTDMRAVRTLRVEDDAVVDLGIEWKIAEFPLLDDLLTRIQRGDDTSSLATDDVVADVRSVIAGAEPTWALSFGRELRGGGFLFGSDGWPIVGMLLDVQRDSSGRPRRFVGVRIDEADRRPHRERAPNPSGESVRAVAAAADGSVFAGTHDGLYERPRGGEWKRLDLGKARVASIGTLVRPMHAAAELLAVTNVGEVVRTTDDGASWAVLGHLNKGWSTPAIAVATDAERTMYLGIETGLFFSRDSGATWTPIFDAPRAVFALAVDEAAGVVYVGAEDGIYRIAAGGSRSIRIGDRAVQHGVLALAVGSGVPKTIYAGTLAHGVWRSSDAGATWQAASVGLEDQHVFALAVDEEHPTRVFAGTERGLFRSDNGGESWALVPTSPRRPAVYSLLVTPSSVLAGILRGGLLEIATTSDADVQPSR